MRKDKTIDKANGNIRCWYAVLKNNKNVKVVFEVFYGTENDIPEGYQNIDCHMIFSVKMGENFHRKVWTSNRGHYNATPAVLN